MASSDVSKALPRVDSKRLANTVTPELRRTMAELHKALAPHATALRHH